MRYFFIFIITTCSILTFFIPTIGAQHFEVEGSIIIGGTGQDSQKVGTIRWNPKTEVFEGYTGSRWVNFGGTGSQWGAMPIAKENYALNTDLSQTQNSAMGAEVKVGLDKVLVGAPNHDSKGAVYHFELRGDQPFLNQIITVSGLNSQSHFGNAIDLDLDYLIVGALGDNRAFVFEYDGLNWSLMTELIPPGITFGLSNFYGTKVAITGTHAFVTDPGGNSGKGVIYVYEQSGNTWNFTQTITDPSGTNSDEFGQEIDAHANLLSVSAPRKNTSGRVLLYAPGSFSQWQLLQTLSDNTTDSNNFGHAVAISANRIAVSAPGTLVSTGKVFVYYQLFGSWQLMDSILFPQDLSQRAFGHTIGLHGSTLAVGYGNRDPTKPDMIVYNEKDFTYAKQTELTFSDYGHFSQWLDSISIYNDIIAVGNSSIEVTSGNSDGMVYVYKK